MKKIEFGISTWLYENASLEEAVERLGRAGFRVLELWGNTHLHPDRLGEINGKALKRLMRRFGMRAHSLHVPFKPEFDLAAPEANLRLLAVQGVAESMKFAAALRPGIIVAHPGNDRGPGADDPREYRDYCKRVAESLRRLAGMAARHSCVLAVENMPHGKPWNPEWIEKKYQFGWSLPQLRKLTSAIPNAGICLDVGHAHLSGIPIAQSSVVDKRIVSFHVHDNNAVSDFHYVPGKGTLDWKRFLSLFCRRKSWEGFIFEISGGENPDQTLDDLVRVRKQLALQAWRIL